MKLSNSRIKVGKYLFKLKWLRMAIQIVLQSNGLEKSLAIYLICSFLSSLLDPDLKELFLISQLYSHVNFKVAAQIIFVI